MAQFATASFDQTDIARLFCRCCICQEHHFLIPSGPSVMFKLCTMQTSEISLQSATIGSDVISPFRHDQLMFFKFFFYELTRL